MQVELPKALRLLSHELRTPLGVLQGYLRILRDGPVDKESQANMLKAMLNETGRITTIARQASDLAAWQSRSATLEPVQLSVKSVVDRVAATAPPLDVVRLPAEAAHWHISSYQGSGLVDALSAVSRLVRLETPDEPTGIATFLGTSNASATIAIGPSNTVGSYTEGSDVSEEKRLSLDAGGHGLALLVAAAVLDAHAAQLSTTRNTAAITLPLRGQE
jgi:hypothetical protein